MLLRKQQNETECYLEAGEQAFPFQMQLSKKLPSSFAFTDACVTYNL